MTMGKCVPPVSSLDLTKIISIGAAFFIWRISTRNGKAPLSIRRSCSATAERSWQKETAFWSRLRGSREAHFRAFVFHTFLYHTGSAAESPYCECQAKCCQKTPKNFRVAKQSGFPIDGCSDCASHLGHATTEELGLVKRCVLALEYWQIVYTAT